MDRLAVRCYETRPHVDKQSMFLIVFNREIKQGGRSHEVNAVPTSAPRSSRPVHRARVKFSAGNRGCRRRSIS